MKIALLVCKGRQYIDSSITETTLSFLEYVEQYTIDKGYYSFSVLEQDENQIRVLLQTTPGEQTLYNTLGLIAFTAIF